MYDGDMVSGGQGAESGYATIAKTTGSNRQVEAKIFAKIIAALNVAKHKQEQGDVSALADALHKNNVLWTKLAMDVAHEGNQLPGALKTQIINLCQFTQSHSRKVLLGEADVDPLVTINTAIMRGLQGITEGGPNQETTS